MVTGSRRWRDGEVIRKALWDVTGDTPNVTVIQGCATGADAIARSMALDMGFEVEDYWPDYAHFSFSEANRIRNRAMVDSGPDLVLAFPLPGSQGTWHAVNYAKDRNIRVEIIDP